MTRWCALVLTLLVACVACSSSSDAHLPKHTSNSVVLNNDSTGPIRVSHCPDCAKTGLIVPATESRAIGPARASFVARIMKQNGPVLCLRVAPKQSSRTAHVVNLSAAKRCH